MDNKNKYLAAVNSFLAILAILVSSDSLYAATPQSIIIGTGGVTGVYYPAGNAICGAISRTRKATNLYCSVERSSGSVANLAALSKGQLDLALAQSDTKHKAYNGSDVFTDIGPNKDLRSVFTLYPESFTLVASRASGIKSFDDLAGKRVNIGNPGSGHRAIMDALMQTEGWSRDSFLLSSELGSSEHSQALCNDEIDAFVFSAGHPSASLKEAANTCDVVMVTLSGPGVDKLVASNSFYHKTEVPGGMYRGNENSISTFGVNAALVASATHDADLIYSVVKSVVENLDAVKKTHPAFEFLSAGGMAMTGAEIPMHDGAKKYFIEAGLYDE